MKKAIIIGSVLILVLASVASASMFGWWADLFADPIAPELVSSQADPIKVMPGDNLRIILEVQSQKVATSATANFNHEKGFDIVPLALVNFDKDTNKQTYIANWEVHDTLDQVWYTTDFELTFADNMVLSGSVDWQDPTVSHSTSQILPGTFSEGNFVFNGSLDVDSIRQKGLTTLSNSITGNAATASDLGCTNCIGPTEILESSLSMGYTTVTAITTCTVEDVFTTVNCAGGRVNLGVLECSGPNLCDSLECSGVASITGTSTGSTCAFRCRGTVGSEVVRIRIACADLT